MTSLSHGSNPGVHAGPLQPAIDCFLAAITDISECLEASGAELAAPHLDRIARIRKRLAFEPSVQALEEGRDTLHDELTTYARKVRRSRDGCSEDLTEILIMLAQAGDAFALRKDGYAEQFRHFSRLMEQADHLQDPQEIRTRLSRQIDNLREFVEAVYQENERSFAQMREQLEDYRVRLQTSALPQSVDPRSGLPGVAEFEIQLAVRSTTSRDFCLLKFRLHDATGVQQRFGDPCRDEVLKLIGAALACQVRARDFVSRWSSDEFLVILECNARTGQARASQIAKWLSGGYSVESQGDAVVIDVQLAVKVFEREAQETPESVLSRVRA